MQTILICIIIIDSIAKMEDVKINVKMLNVVLELDACSVNACVHRD